MNLSTLVLGGNYPICNICKKSDYYYSLIDIDGRILTDVNYIHSSSLTEFNELFLFCGYCSCSVGLNAACGQIQHTSEKKYVDTSINIFSLEAIRSLIHPDKKARRLIRHVARHNLVYPRPVLSQYRQFKNLPKNYERALFFNYFFSLNLWLPEIIMIILSFFDKFIFYD